MWMRAFLTSGIAAALVIACGGKASTGDGSNGIGQGGTGSGGSAGGSDECSAAADCAVPAVCQVCADGTCAVPDVSCNSGACDIAWRCGGSGGAGGGSSGGAGGAGGGGVCASDSDCSAPAVCEVCPDGTYSCASAACEQGACVGYFPPCGGTGTGGAGGSGGGSQCSSDVDCAVPEMCQVCADGSYSCAKAECVAGQCATSYPACGGGYDPCAGRACGEQCFPCDPSDPSCVAPAVVFTCDGAGQCSVGKTDTCGSGNQCRTDSDCPMVGAPCEQCPDGSWSCPTSACVNGLCTGSWPRCDHLPPDPSGCTSDAQCNVTDSCKACSNGACASGVCTGGVCEWVCPM